MNSFQFIPVHVQIDKTSTQLQFINCRHVQRLWQQDTTVYIELSDYTVLEVPNENVHSLVERFAKQ